MMISNKPIVVPHPGESSADGDFISGGTYMTRQTFFSNSLIYPNRYRLCKSTALITNFG
jgi:hypothetical protein